MKMRIGILTWFFVNNYGARAHTYALRGVLREMGHECEFVNFIPPNALKVNLLGNINCVSPKRHPYRVGKCLLRCCRYRMSRRLNPHGVRIRDGVSLDAAGYDLLILGSDAIWNSHHPLFTPLYFGVGVNRTPVCSYAPSCEYLKTDDALAADCVASLKRMLVLTTRDAFSRDFIRSQCDCKPEIVLDPALLYDFSTLETLPGERDYLLVYTFSDWNEYAVQIRRYANEKRLHIVSVGRYCEWADISYDAASIREWLGLFKQATVVVTDSYHGTIFAAKNEKPLAVLSRDDKKYKIEDLLAQLWVNIPFYTGGSLSAYLLMNVIAYDRVRERIREKREESLRLLRHAVGLAKGKQKHGNR